MQLFEVLDQQLCREPDAIIYDWIGRDAKPEVRLTASQLKRQALTEAQRLLETTCVNDVIGLSTSSGPDFVIGLIGCIYAGRTALPLPGPRSGPSQKRLFSALAAVRPAVVLTTAQESVRLLGDVMQIGASVQIIGTAAQAEFTVGDSNRADIAVAQFTSGTTRAAEAVLITESAILANAKFVANAYGASANDRSFTWLPHYHDMGLFGGLLFPLLTGQYVAQMSPYLFIQRPLRWFEALTATAATMTGGPAFALSLCLDRIAAEAEPDTWASFDLSRIRAFFCGAEPIPRDLLDKLAQRLRPTGLDANVLFASYGLAEATLYVAGRPGARHDSSCRIFDDGQHQIRIAATDSAKWLPTGEEGEIVVSGPSLSAGYHGASQLRFKHRGREWLRTGDMGSLADGRLSITGRLKDVLIIRGVTLHAVQVEWLASCVDAGLNPFGAAAFSVVEQGFERAVLLIEPRRAVLLQADVVIDRIRMRLASELNLDNLVIELVAAGTLPRTTSGKVSRTQAKSDYLGRASGRSLA